MTRMELFGTIALAVALGACGGSGGDTSAPTLPPLQITSSNAKTVSGGVFGTSGAVGGLGDSSRGIATQSAGGGGSSLAGLSERVLLQAFREQQSLTISIVVTRDVPCESGSITLRANDADNNGELSTGDTADATFNQCANGGETLSGSLSISDVVVTGDAASQVAPWGLAATFAFNNLVLTQAGEESSINGSFSFSVDTPDNTSSNTSIRANSITVTDSGFTETLSNFDLTAGVDTSTLAYSTEFDGTFSSQRVDGSVTFDTTQTFRGVGEGFPSEGELLITGANESSVRLIAIDSVNVRLEVDENGDGAVDQAIDTAWEELGNRT
ncbi:MAG: hypothetical protein ACR2RB_15385 [Gammaproteobacteria bacterium]